MRSSHAACIKRDREGLLSEILNPANLKEHLPCLSPRTTQAWSRAWCSAAPRDRVDVSTFRTRGMHVVDVTESKERSHALALDVEGAYVHKAC